MTSESGSPEERRWLAEPPAADEINFQIAAGDQVEITPEIRRAFDTLLETLGGDVEGYEGLQDCNGYIRGCASNTYMCWPRRKCTVETQKACLVDYRCTIAP